MPPRLMPYVFLMLLITHSAGRAQVITDDFDDGDDAGWTHYAPLSAFGAGGAYTFPSGGYRIQAPASPNPAALGPARAGSYRDDAVYSDFVVSADLVDWDDSLQQAIGLVARISDVGLGATDGYTLFYLPEGDSISIQRLDNEFASLADNPEFQFLALNPANDYRFVFTGVGSNLTGQVFDLSDLSAPLATVSADDSTYSSGFTGFVAATEQAAPGGSADATFDNFSAAVPEPGAGVLLIIGGAALVRIRRKR